MTKVSGNRLIAKNTVFTYTKLFTSILVGLFTSRIVLQVLGVSDLGIYSVVAGVLGLFSFIQGALRTATSRFFNIEMGKEDGDLNRSFNVNLLLHVFLALLVFIIAETVGLWYVNNVLSVENGKLADANFVFQVAIITTCLGIINSPFVSLLSANEEFKFISCVDSNPNIFAAFVEAILKSIVFFSTSVNFFLSWV